jgi:CRP-like cAMP-binding protein
MTDHWHLEHEDFFEDLPQLKEEFVRRATKLDLKKNDFVFFEDEPGDRCYLLEQGVVKILRSTMQGKEPIFFIRRAGELFGLAEVIDGKTRKCNAQCLTPCVMYAVAKDDFEFLLAHHHAFARKVIALLGKRLRFLSEQLENVMLHDVTSRLLKILLYLGFSKLSECHWPNSPVTIPRSLTQEEIAAMTGSCQQTVSEILKQFERDGLIHISRKEIKFLKPGDMLERLYH